MKYKTMQEIETRKAAILQEMEQEGADLEALKKEMDELRENAQQIREAAAKAEETRKAIAEGAKGVVIGEARKAEETTQTVDEIRSSQKYMDAFARYLISEDDKECRALLTTNAASGGQVPVPVLVDQIIRTAWDNDQILSRVRKTAFRGNLKVPFERSADGAYVHTEGTSAPTEEDLKIGIVTMIPATIKKWIKISDEAVAMGGEAFLRYVYDELTYQIIRKLSKSVVGDIVAAGTSNTATAIGIPKTKLAPSLTAIPTAYANLSDEAVNPVVIINRLTYVNFLAAYSAGNFAVDPFAGMTVLYSSELPAYDTASENDVYAIVGDLNGAQVNYPEGEGVVIKYDDLTNAEADMVKVVGRQYAAHAVTAPGRFARLTRPADPVTT